MTTRKLLWGMTWRGGKWGVIFGAINYLIIIALDTIVTFVHPCSFDEQCTGANLYGADAMLGLVVFSSPIALPMVSMFSAILGLIWGFLLSILLSNKLIGIENPKSRYDLIKRTGVVIGIVEGFLAFFIVRFSGLAFFISPLLLLLPDTHRSSGYTYGALIGTLFSVVVFAILFGERLARWYERESAKEIAQNVSSN